jgi:Leucine-rich repeat (LRR) protein
MKKILLLLMTVVVTSFAATADVAINSTNFPDANFRAFLKSKYSLSYITTSQLNACTELVMNSLDIADLTGIEYFTQLTKLDCFNNKITSVDLSANTKLKELNLGYNKLSSINLSANTGLEKLYLHNNQLSSSLSIANHSKLELLWVHNNQHLIGINCSDDALRNLNVTNCISLTTLECYNNTSLTTITGLGTCVNLQYLDCDNCSISDLSTLSELNNLAEIYCGHNQLTSLELSEKITLVTLDVSGNTQLTYLLCSRSRLQSRDVTGRTALEDPRCFYNNPLPTITGLADCTAMRYLDCEDCRISDLSALSGMDNLEEIYCGRNRLTSLELSQKVNLVTLSVSGNTQLTYLLCSRAGRLQSLNVTGCTALEDLRCFYNNRLASITGLADCTALKYLDCEDCSISSLSALNGMTNLETLLCADNKLVSLTVSGNSQLSMLTVNRNPSLASLFCRACDLSSLDLSGCEALEYLDGRENSIASLDVTMCPELGVLMCSGNELTELNLVNNTMLIALWCNNNHLTELDLSHCSDEFYSLDCSWNQITSLDVSRFSELFQLNCRNNQIPSLNVANLPYLRDLWCNNNPLTTLDVSGCNDLELLNTASCQLASLNVADCPKLNTVAVYYNKLKGQPVSQFVSGLPQRPSDDKGLLYAVALDYENGAEGNHMTADQVAQAQAKNWDLFAKSGNEWIPYGGEMVRGDVNGDGMVTIADVTALIDALLAGQTPDAGDVNGDFNVTIADVTALIDGLLSGSFSLSAHAGIKTSISLDEEIQLTIDNEELQARLNRMRTR